MHIIYIYIYIYILIYAACKPVFVNEFIPRGATLSQSGLDSWRANADGIYRLEWTPPPITLSKKSAARTIVRRPERDLILLETFALWFDGAHPDEFGLPVAQIYQDERPTLRGVLIRAQNWNTPEGCRRIISEDEYCFVREQTIARTDTELATGDTEKTWQTNIQDMAVRAHVITH